MRAVCPTNSHLTLDPDSCKEAVEGLDMGKLLDGHAIVIKPNNAITNDPCAICGARCDPDGLDFFLEGTERLVCDRCATRIAPKLSRLKNVYSLDDECPL